MIEKSTKKINITKIFEPNTFKQAEFYVWDEKLKLYQNDEKFKTEKQEATVCLTRVSPDDKNKEDNESSSLPKFHITIVQNQPKGNEDNLTNKNKFLAFLIDQDYMVNPSIVEITTSMGSPYHIILKV